MKRCFWNRKHKTTLARRILVATITIFVCAQAVTWLSYLAGILLLDTRTWSNYMLWGYAREPSSWRVDLVAVSLLVRATALLLPWYFLVRWSRLLSRGETVWFSRLPTPTLVLLVAILMGTNTIVPQSGSLFGGLIQLPFMTWFFLIFGVGPTPWGQVFWAVLIGLTLIHAAIFAVLIVTLLYYKNKLKNTKRRMRWLLFAAAWTFPVVLYVLSTVALRGIAGRGDSLEDIYRILLSMPLHIVSAGLVYGSCGAWLWWCRMPDQPMRIVLFLAGIWALLASYGSIVALVFLELSYGIASPGQVLLRIDYFELPLQLIRTQHNNWFPNPGLTLLVGIWMSGMAGIVFVAFVFRKTKASLCPSETSTST